MADSNKDEANKALGIAVKNLENGNYEEALVSANRARLMNPRLPGIKKLVMLLQVLILSADPNITYYKLLGVEETATGKEIQLAYSKLDADLNPATNKFPKASEAHGRIIEAMVHLLRFRSNYDNQLDATRKARARVAEIETDIAEIETKYNASRGKGFLAYLAALTRAAAECEALAQSFRGMTYFSKFQAAFKKKKAAFQEKKAAVQRERAEFEALVLQEEALKSTNEESLLEADKDDAIKARARVAKIETDIAKLETEYNVSRGKRYLAYLAALRQAAAECEALAQRFRGMMYFSKLQAAFQKKSVAFKKKKAAVLEKKAAVLQEKEAAFQRERAEYEALVLQESLLEAPKVLEALKSTNEESLLEADKDDAIKAQEIAIEKANQDLYPDALMYARMAQRMNPDLPNIKKLVASMEILSAPSDTTHYKLLGIEKTDDPTKIKSAFRKLSNDVNPDQDTFPKASEALKRIASAASVLSDTQSRAKYNQTLNAARKSAHEAARNAAAREAAARNAAAREDAAAAARETAAQEAAAHDIAAREDDASFVYRDPVSGNSYFTESFSDDSSSVDTSCTDASSTDDSSTDDVGPGSKRPSDAQSTSTLHTPKKKRE